MSAYDYLKKKYGKEAIKLSCEELESLGLHANKYDLEKLCKKYSNGTKGNSK
jgi:hypothetical protein